MPSTPKTPVEVSFRKSRVDGWKVITEKKTAWVVKMDDNSVVAYGPAMHPPRMRLSLGREQIGIHLSRVTLHSFLRRWKVISGPAPRPLDRYVTRIDGGNCCSALAAFRRK